ncbi:hypothetical protein [Mesorhizobium sp.]|nr:hypothetical protein [Mesorhizobium sp.]
MPTRIAPIGVVTSEIQHRLLGAFTLASWAGMPLAIHDVMPPRLLVHGKR